MRKVVRTFASLALLAGSMLTTGCYKATFIDPNAVAGAEHEEWLDFFVFGTVGTEEYDVRKFCSGPVAVVRTGGNFATGLVSLLTIGIYMPRKIYVTCAAGPIPAGPPQGAQLEVELDRAGEPLRVSGTVGSAAVQGEALPMPGTPGGYRVRLRKAGAL